MKKGFTLIELLIVVAIIGILAAVGAAVIPGLLDNTKRNTADALCHEVINDVKIKLAACSIGTPLYLKLSSGKLNTNREYCSYSQTTQNLSQLFPAHYATIYTNPYFNDQTLVNVSCPNDDSRKPGCIEMWAVGPNTDDGIFRFRCYNKDRKGNLTSYNTTFDIMGYGLNIKP